MASHPLPLPAPAPDAPLFIVINEGSGKHEGETPRETIAALLEAAGRRHAFLVVEDPAHIAGVAKAAVARARAEGGIVVAAGGDGTLNAVAQAVAGSGCACGVLPQGTFNYFGRTHGIPQDLADSVPALLRASVEPVQVGRVNGHVFLVNASLGLYPEILQDREGFKKKLGRSRWVAIFSGLRTLMREGRRLQLEIESENGRQRVRTPSLFVGNNRLQLDRLGLPEEAALADGRLAGIMVRPMGHLAMLGLALRGALGKLGDADNVRHFPFRKMTVSPRGNRLAKVAVDGEILWLRTPLVFEVSPEPLPLMMPRRQDRAPVE
ncbi:diacylglycerol kinase family protein [Arenimonas sp.]|uniref:diacylglycerol/lipid kinase family protein n=1 Tax=Arenimonas sp. TaxID=1872635 RepID=UPI0035ADFCE2